MSWIDDARRPVSAVVAALGWDGDDRRGYPCPACKEPKRDRRGAVGVTRGGDGWLCHVCGAKGDGLDFLAFALAGARLREVADKAAIREFCAGSGWAVAISAPAPPPTPVADVSEFWRSCVPVPSTDSFVISRRWGVVPPDLARFTPVSGPWPEWWPAGRARVWRLVTRGYTADGDARNIHGRAVVDPGEMPKTLWATGIGAAGLLFWNGVMAHRADLVIIAEGLTDWLTLALWAVDRRIAVYGGTSGGFSALARLEIVSDVVIAVDEDSAGDAYCSTILSHVGHRRCSRVRPSIFSPRLASPPAQPLTYSMAAK